MRRRKERGGKKYNNSNDDGMEQHNLFDLAIMYLPFRFLATFFATLGLFYRRQLAYVYSSYMYLLIYVRYTMLTKHVEILELVVEFKAEQLILLIFNHIVVLTG